VYTFVTSELTVLPNGSAIVSLRFDSLIRHERYWLLLAHSMHVRTAQMLCQYLYEQVSPTWRWDMVPGHLRDHYTPEVLVAILRTTRLKQVVTHSQHDHT
jgi:hypothetical protein